MEICPKQQDAALNLLVKTLRLVFPAMRSQGAAPGGSASLWAQPLAQGHPGPLPRPGSRSSPTLPPQSSKNLVPLNPSSA